MFNALVFLVAITGPAAFVSAVHGKPALKDACTSWNQWKTSLQSDTDAQLTCNINTYCTGIRCFRQYQDFKLDLELLAHNCDDPVGVEFRLSLPQWNIRNWNHTFVRRETVPLPSDSEASGDLDVFLQRRDEETVVFGCAVLKRTSNGKSVNILTVSNRTIKLPPCKKAQQDAGKRQRAANRLSRGFTDATAGKPCNLDELRGCGKNEMCEEVRHSDPPRAACICLPDFHWFNNLDLECVPIVPSAPTDGATTNSSNIQPSSNSSQTMAAVQIAVPLVLIALIATLVVLAYRFRWVSKLRARLRRRPTSHVYEEMIIDGDEAGSIHSLTADPVA